jgi:hypothetical protein
VRLVLILDAVVVMAVVVLLIAYGTKGGARSSVTSWETHTESVGGTTKVLVRQVTRRRDGELAAELGRQVIAEIPDADPDWEARYHVAMASARSRVAALEAQLEAQ